MSHYFRSGEYDTAKCRQAFWGCRLSVGSAMSSEGFGLKQVAPPWFYGRGYGDIVKRILLPTYRGFLFSSLKSTRAVGGIHGWRFIAGLAAPKSTAYPESILQEHVLHP